MTTLEDLSARVRALPDAMLYRIGPELSAAIRQTLGVTIRQGTSPEGEPWEPRKPGSKKGSAPVLKQAFDSVRVGQVNLLIIMRIIGVEARHHRGIAKGGVERPIILHDGITEPVARAMSRVITEAFNETTSGK